MQITVRDSVDLLVAGGAVRGCEIALAEQKRGAKVLLVTPFSYFGEDVCAYLKLHDIPEFLAKLGVTAPARPVQIKYALDRVMLENRVPFLFQTFVLGVQGDCVIFANREGLFAVRARAVLDTTPFLTAAHAGNMPFEPFNPGKYRAVCRALVSCEEGEAEYMGEGKFYRLEEKHTEVELSAWQEDAFFRATLEVRNNCWSPAQFQSADLVEFAGLPAPMEDSEKWIFTIDQYRGIQREAVSTAQTVAWDVSRTRKADIVVTGGGTAGAAAAIPGAQAGLDTLVLERLSHLGGTGTQGRICVYWFGLKNGYTRHLDEEVRKAAMEEEVSKRWPSEPKQHVWERENISAGAAVWFNTFCCALEKEDDKIVSVLAATPMGGIRIEAAQFLDCTGNAELARLAGAPTEFSAPEEPAYQGSGMCPVVLGKNYSNSDYMFTVDDSTQDVSRAYITGRERCAAYFDVSQLPGTRERRRIIGEVVLTASDFYAKKHYDDTVALACSNFDTHGFTVAPLLLFHPTDHDPYIAEIPFRALLSPGVANLMTTGLGISAQRDAMPLIRMQSDVQNQGYAAGLLAAEAVQSGRELRRIDLAKVQEKLRAMGFFTPDCEIPESGLNQDAAIFAAPDLASLRADFQKAPDFEKALRLALLGYSDGAELLKKAVSSQPWDDGWDYRGMGQFGKSVSRLDAAIIALRNFAGDAAFLMPRLKELQPESQFSHFRAVSLYLQKHPSREAVPELRRLLGAFECHAKEDLASLLDAPFEGLTDVAERNFQLRELYLAGALHACDPADELAKSFLERYQKGVHRLYAIYAGKWGK